MKVIMTGGTGLIGRALTANLSDDGHQVVVLTRSPRKTDAIRGAELVAWDGRKPGDWVTALEGADAVVNLAGASLDQRWTPAHKQLVLESRVRAGQLLVEAIKQLETKPSVLVQASAVGYYGPHEDEEITEDDPVGSDFLAGVCKQWEASTEEIEAMGVRRVIIRSGIVLSRRGGALARMILPYRFFVGGSLGSGKQYMPWIHISDEINAIRFLLNTPNTSGAYNLTAPNPVTNRQFAKALGAAINRPSIMPAPGLALKLMLGEMSTLVLDGQRVVPARLQSAGHEFRFTNPETALRHLFYSGFEF